MKTKEYRVDLTKEAKELLDEARWGLRADMKTIASAAITLTLTIALRDKLLYERLLKEIQK